MGVRVAKNKTIDLEFYSADGAVLVVASWDEDEEQENPALEIEVLAKLFSA
jgi:hypothetical protein